MDFFSTTGCFLFKFEPFKVDFLLRSNRSRLRGKFTVEDRRLINNWLMYSFQNIKCFKIYRNIQNNILTKLLHLPKKKTRTKIHPPKRCFTSLLVGHSGVVLLLARGIQSQSLFPTNKYSFDFPTIGYSIGISRLFTFWNNIKKKYLKLLILLASKY